MNDTITTWKCLLQPKKSRRLRFKLPSQLSVLVSHNSTELSYHILSHLSLKRNEEINIQITLTLRLTHLGTCPPSLTAPHWPTLTNSAPLACLLLAACLARKIVKTVKALKVHLHLKTIYLIRPNVFDVKESQCNNTSNTLGRIDVL